MGTNSEDYLEGLLRSVEEKENKSKSFSNLFRSPEEDFLKDFEKEILAEGDNDYLREFERELGGAHSSGMGADDIISGLKDRLGTTEEPVVEDVDPARMAAISEPAAPEEPTVPTAIETYSTSAKTAQQEASPYDSPEYDIEVNTLDESLIGSFTLKDENSTEPAVGMPEAMNMLETVEPLAATIDGEVDLTGQGEKDLMEMLKNDESFSDLSDIFAGGDAAAPESSEAIDSYMQNEMNTQAAQASGEAESGGKKGKKEGGFLKRLTAALFGGDEDEGQNATGDQLAEIELGSLSDENRQILEELDAAEGKAAKKAKKKEKPKKEKKPKAPKPKKEPKPKKPPKVKEPKPKDNTPPLPKKPVILIVIMVASLAGLVLLGTSALSYQPHIQEAKGQYSIGNYEEANKQLQGLTIKKADEQFYDQTCVMAAIDSEYRAYRTFLEHDMKDLALDSLICALGRCDVNREKAEECDCILQLEHLEEEVAEVLRTEYGISKERAMKAYKMWDRESYTQELYRIMREAGLL